MTSTIRKEIERLRKEIERHNYLYYITNTPEISDAEYDALYQRLEALEAAHPETITRDSPTQRVGSSPSDSFSQIEHSIPMLSFGNAFDEEGLLDFDRRVRSHLDEASVAYVAEPKLDGLAVELVYRDGRLVNGSTRGDGRIGEDVTENLRTIRSIPLRLRTDVHDAPSVLEVRGEVFIERAAFEQLNRTREHEGLPTYANPRNLAAGTLRQLDARITASRPLSIYCYDIGRVEGLEISTQLQLLKILPELGLRVNPLYRMCESIDAVIEFYREMKDGRTDLPYEADGIVVKVNDFSTRRSVGAVSRSPRWAIAGKFPASRGMTRLRDITISVGRTGVLTPIAVLEPVHVHGVEISSATLHNEDEIERKDIRIGDQVIVERAGDVIPKISRAMHELRTGSERTFVMPEACPVCKTPVERSESEVAYRCPNLSCPARIVRSILHFISKGALDIDGMGPRLVEQLVDRDHVRTLGDLFRLDRSTLLGLDRLGPKSSDNLLAALERAKNVKLSRFLFGLGIPGVGAHLAERLAQTFSSLTDLSEASADALAELPEFGPLTAESIAAFFSSPHGRAAIDDLLDAGVAPYTEEPDKTPGTLASQRFVFTGTLARLPRAEASARVKALGGDVGGSVTAKTTYVVVGENPGSKAAKAEQLGIPTLTEDAFLDLLRSHE